MTTYTTKSQQIYKDQQPWFYCADTCWSAFTNIDLPDWRTYLDQRQRQGFTAIQMDILRQWDASGAPKTWEPFAVTRNGDQYTYDYDHLNPAYFDHAAAMLKEVVARGLTPVLVLLWGNYVPQTWMHHAGFVQVPNQTTMSPVQIKHYVTAAVQQFQQFDPIYFVSGDVDFPTAPTEDDPIMTAYSQALAAAKAVDPHALYAFHINGENSWLPPELRNQADFFTYQSGHGAPGQATAYQIPQKLRQQGYSGPILNAEPCYEAMPAMGAATPTRFSNFDVRRASWQSILAGADAGITYGAHGIWSWHVTGESHVYGNGAMMPLDWHKALALPGANDISFLHDFITTRCTRPLEPLAVTFTESADILAAKTTCDGHPTILLYVPNNLILDLSPLHLERLTSVTAIDLTSRYPYRPAQLDTHTLDLMHSVRDSLVLIQL